MMKLSCYKPGKGRTPSKYFAVPDEDFQTGVVTGTKLFLEMLESMKTSGESHPCYVQLLMGEMGAVLNEKERGSKSRRGAATTVSSLMADALLHFAKNANVKPWLDRKLAAAEQSKVWWDERDANHKAEFVARMGKAKAAKIRDAVQDAMCASMTV